MNIKQLDYAELVNMTFIIYKGKMSLQGQDSVAEVFNSKMVEFCQKYTSHEAGQEALAILQFDKILDGKIN